MAKVKTPVIRNLRSLFKEPLPEEPVILHMFEDEWKMLSQGLRNSKGKIRKEAKGLFVVPDVYGGYLAFFACAAGSGEGEACIPELVISGRVVTTGGGCLRLRGKDPVDPPVAERETCSLGISAVGGFTCTGTCSRGKSCKLVKIPSGSGGRVFITCQCS